MYFKDSAESIWIEWGGGGGFFLGFLFFFIKMYIKFFLEFLQKVFYFMGGGGAVFSWIVNFHSSRCTINLSIDLWEDN